VDLNRDGVLLGLAEVDSQVTEVLDELACCHCVRLFCLPNRCLPPKLFLA
jgi:hypothetical protein